MPQKGKKKYAECAGSDMPRKLSNTEYIIDNNKRD
jgi:hypothetical protein